MITYYRKGSLKHYISVKAEGYHGIKIRMVIVI